MIWASPDGKDKQENQMKLILENWNNFRGKQPLNERQIRNLKIKYPILSNNGILKVLLESKHNFHVPSVLHDAQCFYQNSIEMANGQVVLSIIKEGIQNQIKLYENEEETEEPEEEPEQFDPFSHLRQFAPSEEEEIDEEDCVLTFGIGNTKLAHLGSTNFSLPAGYSCPFADICKSQVPRKGGSVKDFGDVRCFQASLEMGRPNVRAARWRNFDLVKKAPAHKVTNLILKSLRHHEQSVRGIQMLRIHDSGDFFSQNYFDGWLDAVKRRPDIVFYAYTKAIPFWKARKDKIPSNLRLIASRGGKADDQIEDDFRQAIIVSDMEQAIEQNLNVDVNEFLAIFGEGDFALLLHGTQPKGQWVGGRKATSVARENNKLIKDMAKQFRVPKKTLRAMMNKITDAAQREYERSIRLDR
jgi:hypothetical protein